MVADYKGGFATPRFDIMETNRQYTTQQLPHQCQHDFVFLDVQLVNAILRMGHLLDSTHTSHWTLVLFVVGVTREH